MTGSAVRGDVSQNIALSDEKCRFCFSQVNDACRGNKQKPQAAVAEKRLFPDF